VGRNSLALLGVTTACEHVTGGDGRAGDRIRTDDVQLGNPAGTNPTIKHVKDLQLRRQPIAPGIAPALIPAICPPTSTNSLYA